MSLLKVAWVSVASIAFQVQLFADEQSYIN